MLKKILIVVGLLVAGTLGFVVYSIGPRNIVGMIRYDQRKEGSLRVGSSAPDVELVALDGTRRVHLKEFTGSKPLVLVFGSYT